MPLIKPEEESLLLAALRRAFRRSSFWRERLLGLGLSEADFTPGFAFEQLPLLSKADLLNDQAAHPPFGRLLAVDRSDIRRIHKTSGTTATPLFIALTAQDIDDSYTAAVRAFAAAGMSANDIVIHCLNFNMWSGGVTDYIPIERLGASGVPFGVGNTALLLHTIRTLGVNAISGTPSYMFVLRDRCREELGVDPRELGLRRGYFGGEGLLQIPGVREEIEQAFGMVAMDANYGMSEVLSVIGGEGPERNGLIYHCHGILYAELIDPAGSSQPIVEAARGELVFSSLRREGQPLFRYRTNDIAEILWTDTGEDGLGRMRFRIIGRSDEMLVVKGVNFFPQSMLTILREFEPAVGRELRVVRPSASQMEELCVVMETDVSGEEDRAALAQAIQQRAAALLQVRIQIHWTPKEFIPCMGNKSKFLINTLEDAGLG